MATGVELIAVERDRQVVEENWTREGDVAQHTGQELALAASSYALPAEFRGLRWTRQGRPTPWFWPWLPHWWKPTPEDRVRELVKAGALVAAEIDRLQALP